MRAIRIRRPRLRCAGCGELTRYERLRRRDGIGVLCPDCDPDRQVLGDGDSGPDAPYSDRLRDAFRMVEDS